MQSFKEIILKLLKFSGVFYLFSIINSKKIAILCYHSIALEDEADFLPANFISIEKFKKRMNFLINKGYSFISLDQAIDDIKNKKIRKKSIVITIDDGFESIFNEMIPFLVKKNIPVTLYVTTKKSQENTPVFKLIFQYTIWKAQAQFLNTTILEEVSDYKEHKLDLSHKEHVINFITFCEKRFNDVQRERLLYKIAKQLKVQLSSDLVSSFSIADLETIEIYSDKGLDVQLHTHSHNMHLPQKELEKDISKNKDLLSELNDEASHFCYPSGVHSEKDYKLLESLGIESATTCEHGIIGHDANLFCLPRIVDSESMHEIVFESELNGLSSILRKMKRLLQRIVLLRINIFSKVNSNPVLIFSILQAS